MENTSCSSCHKPKANLLCGICNSAVCKSCAEFVEEGRFSFLPLVPEDLNHTTFCPACFQEKVAPEMASYDELMEQAKSIIVYEKDQGKETRLIKRNVPPVKVADVPDRAETMLRLAFLAAKAGFNAIIDVDIRSQKVKINNYQTTIWSGTAVPAHINPDRVVKDRSLWQNPN